MNRERKIEGKGRIRRRRRKNTIKEKKLKNINENRRG